MGSIVIKSILDKAAILLLDVPNARWTRPELLGWANDAIRAILQVKPSEFNKVVSVKLVAGTRQTLPADARLLMDVTRNMGTNGTTPGNIIRLISREILDGYKPNWHASKADTSVQNYMYDPQDPRAFYVFPPATGANFIEINYAMTPTDMVSETATLPIDDVYQPSILDYIVFRCCSKDAEYAPGVQLAATYYGMFKSSIEEKERGELENNPNLGLTPMNPSAKGTAK